MRNCWVVPGPKGSNFGVKVSMFLDFFKFLVTQINFAPPVTISYIAVATRQEEAKFVCIVQAFRVQSVAESVQI